MESKMEKTDNVEDKKAEDVEPLLLLQQQVQQLQLQPQQLLQQQSLQMQQNQTELATLRQQVQELGERQHAGLIPQPQHQPKHQPPHQSPHQPQHQPTHPTYHSPLAGLYGPEQPTAYRSEQRLFRQRRREARRLWRQVTCRDCCGSCSCCCGRHT
ncbi:uncharacterized protein LOC117609737 [Osmia lignaria lignaria]|uniref:uncharacterized protein LOC117609737 n=1 Tax=Osmia lignaria lignaria TaxID=1437193 RepID=UPI0014784639|nr:putative mediator of RNA polymerase II transcription subunit 26 [Osmia lignaria]